MNMWLVGAGYWGSKIKSALDRAGVHSTIIDIRNGQSIADISGPGAVILATPLWNHYEQCKLLLAQGRDLYVEKPMAETFNEVHQLQMMADPQQLVMVGHIFQHHPQRDEIKTLIGIGTIGTLQHITSRRLNWGIYQTKTDPVLSLGTHDISIIDDFVEHDQEIIAAQAYHLSANLQPDRVTWQGRAGAVTFDCDVSWCWPVRTRQTVFIGTEGQIVWNQDDDSYTVTHHRVENNRAVADPAPEQVIYKGSITALDCEVSHWVDCVRTRQQPSTGFAQALNVAHVIDQIKRLL